MRCTKGGDVKEFLGNLCYKKEELVAAGVTAKGLDSNSRHIKEDKLSLKATYMAYRDEVEGSHLLGYCLVATLRVWEGKHLYD